jgi:uncharacterized protein (DUF1501 family)
MTPSSPTGFLNADLTSQAIFSDKGLPVVNSAQRSSLFGASNIAAVVNQIRGSDRSNLLEKDFNAIRRRSTDIAATLNPAMGGSALPTSVTDAMPDSSMGRALRSVIRAIAANGAVGAKRQVFFAWNGAFDMHDDLTKAHGPKLGDMSACMSGFYAAMVALGLQDQVTLFTASDLGRVLVSNCDGCDHGWGGHHFIVGGSVRGGQVYGAWPQTRLGGNQDIGNGIMIPTTSVDQHMATLAKWMGVSAGNVADIVPRIGRYNVQDLGFMV